MENRCSEARSSPSPVVIAAGISRIVEQCKPTTGQARRSEMLNRSHNAMMTALRLRFGVKKYPDEISLRMLIFECTVGGEHF